jgi:hypothetical protein
MLDAKHQKSKQPSHLKDLLLLFSIPVGIAVLAAGVVYLPRVFAHPKYDFIYSYCNNYSCKDSYSVDSNGYVAKGTADPKYTDYYDSAAMLRYYDAESDSTKSLSFEEVLRHKLDTSSKSPDGYSLSRGDDSSGFLFVDRGAPGWYLKNGLKQKKVDLATSNTYYSDQVRFLGWITK